MGQFACIQFNQDNILISKKDIAHISEINYLGYEGYQIKFPCSVEHVTLKQWNRLNKTLDDYNIEYLGTKEKIDYPFTNQVVIDGNQFKPYLSKGVLDYISKYELIRKKPLFFKVGIIAGDLQQMMGVISSIMHDVSELVIFSDTPYMYKDMLQEIYKETRLKARSLVPCSATLRGMDLIFDCLGRRNYAKWCQPKAIYIDFNQYFINREIIFQDYPPIIWYDFDIVCDRQQIPIELLQSILLSQGITKRLIPLTLKKMQLKLSKPYTIGIS